MKGKELIIFGIILLVSAIILFFFADEFYNTAYRNYIWSAFGGNPSYYKSQMELWSFLKNIISPTLAFAGICLMIAGVFDLSKQSDKNSKLHTIDKNRFCPNCRRVIPLDAKMCPYCGNDFQTISKEDKIQFTEAKEGKSEKAKFCTQCGTSLEGNSKFCNQCGTKLR